MKKTLFLLLTVTAMTANAQVKLQPLFTDNMVLQQQSDAPLWGESKPNKKVTVTTSWDKQTYTTTADAEGHWTVSVKTPSAGGPYDITISDGKPVKLKNVLIGEVWICSGQSNMEMPLAGWGKIKNYEQEIANANHPRIRIINVSNATSPVPLNTFETTTDGWQECSPQTIAEFSSTGYFFGRDIEKFQNVPVGLIGTNWGGTIAEAWTSQSSLMAMPDFRQAVERVRKMPASREEREASYKKELTDWYAHSETKEGGFDNGKATFAATDFDDSQWKDVQLPARIDNQGYGYYNGFIWVRRTFDIPANFAGKNLKLELGSVDDNDDTYFNGEHIGHTDGVGENRIYTIPARLVKAGKAVLTVRILNTGGYVGIMRDNGIMLSINKKSPAANEVISLNGTWKSLASTTFKQLPPRPRNTVNEPNIASVLYNAMIHPLIPYAIKGAIWYQGEANEGRAYQYRELLPTMINDWRKQWGYNFPFYIAQLASFRKQATEPGDAWWAEVREAQMMTTNLENTGIICLTDIGDANDIHPKNKQEVGRRLALVARAKTYGEQVVYSGPVYKGYRIEGNTIRISFCHTDGGLKTNDGDVKIKGFAIAGLDHKFHWADARIDGNDIIVSSPDVTFPIAVRYAWADNPNCNLCNGEGLPAFPFRTDDWPGLTINRK